MFRAAIVLAVAVTALPVAAQAAPRHTLTLSGSRTASAVVTFRKGVTVYNGDPAEGATGPAFSGNADVAGYLLMDLARTRVVAGLVTTSRLMPQGAPARLSVGDGPVRVPAGRYVLTLVASATTDVRIPVAVPQLRGGGRRGALRDG